MNQNILLPKLAIPNRYEIHLDIDLENFTYNGSETIFIEVVEDTTELQLNSVGLIVNSCFVENDNGAHIDGSVNYLKDDERILLNFEDSIETGDWKLYIDFTGNVVDDLRGFYRSKFIDKNDEEKSIATTQFEPTAARMAFPCWDEPEFKSVFSITLTSNESDIRITGNYANNGNDAALKIDATCLCFTLNSSSYKKFLVRSACSFAECGLIMAKFDLKNRKKLNLR